MGIKVEETLNSVREAYKEKIVEEIEELCNEVIELLDTYLIPNEDNSDVKLLYLKMKSDYYRYLAEVVEGEKKKEAEEKLKAVSKEIYINKEETYNTPTQLGLALSHATFTYEIYGKHKEGIEIARTAFNSGILHLENMNDKDYSEATLLLQLLRDSLTLWEGNEDGIS